MFFSHSSTTFSDLAPRQDFSCGPCLTIYICSFFSHVHVILSVCGLLQAVWPPKLQMLSVSEQGACYMQCKRWRVLSVEAFQTLHWWSTVSSIKKRKIQWFLDPEGGSPNATLVVVVVVVSSIKIPKAFLICSWVQRNFAYTFLLIFPTYLPSQIFKLICN